VINPMRQGPGRRQHPPDVEASAFWRGSVRSLARHHWTGRAIRS